MRFRTSPQPVAYLFTDDVAFRKYIGSVLNVGELDLLDDHSVIVIPLDQDVVRLDIYSMSIIARIQTWKKPAVGSKTCVR